MENTEQKKTYKELPKEGKRALSKEYFKSINPPSKVWLCVVIVATAVALTGVVMHIMYLATGSKDDNSWMSMVGWLTYDIWLIIYSINLPFLIKRQNGFWKWLAETKGISRK